MTWCPLPPLSPQVTSRSCTTENTFSNMFSNRLVMQLVRLLRAGGSADPTLTFPGEALAWRTPHVPAGLWNSRRYNNPLPTVSGNEQGNSDNTEWPRMCINTQKPLTVLCCGHYKSRKFSRVGLFFLEQLRCRGELCCSLRIYVTAFGKPHCPPGTGANQLPKHTLQTLTFVTWDLSLSSSLQRDAPDTQDKSPGI